MIKICKKQNARLLPNIYLSIYLSIYQYVYLRVCVYIYIFIFYVNGK